MALGHVCGESHSPDTGREVSLWYWIAGMRHKTDHDYVACLARCEHVKLPALQMK